MAMSSSKVTGASVGTISRRNDDDEPQDTVMSIGDFLSGEWLALWPAWVLFLLMIAVIV